MKKAFYILLFFGVVSCSNFNLENGFFKNNAFQGKISVATWNVQTFFDAVEDGYEYKDFKGSKSAWSVEKYDQRLKIIAHQLQILEADIVAVQEVENDFVMQDILDYMGLSSPLRYSAFAREDSQSVFGNGVFSKYPIKKLKTHQLNVNFAQMGNPPSMRPIVEVQIQYGDETEILTLLICHWKSKSGGAEKTQIWRDHQQALLVNVVEMIEKKLPANQNMPIIVLGDFNTDINEFTFDDEALIQLSNGKTKKSFFSPWISYLEENDIGSYYYQNSWQAIDHIFLLQQDSQKIHFENFKVHTESHFANSDKTPFRYDIRNGRGSSDHLPISGTLVINSK
ncbi:MAG: endonuclease/exonuclease/phosphatase family protein [Treponemataceae bacterium]